MSILAFSLLIAAHGPVPSKRQLDWQKLELTAFCHFGPNTFYDQEWGQGTEKVERFDPQQLDCDQWCRSLKAGGFKMVIITAKHHDGFCLWPSKFSTHTVAQSRWRGGKGDVLKDLSSACKRNGMKFGVYLSPWDRNHPNYGSPAYNDTFVNMLQEVLTHYGKVSEVWFDGANGEGPNGKRQVYDFPRFNATVRKYAPDAVIFSDAGPDIRWVGNEGGYAGETCWSQMDIGDIHPGMSGIEDRLNAGQANGSSWVPAECDVSIRPGWFWHKDQDDKVRSVANLVDIYFGSVGRNGQLLLNVPPDSRGLIHENDVKRLAEFKAELDRIFSRSLAKSSSQWNSKVATGKTQVKFGGIETVRTVLLREDIRIGQSVAKFRVRFMLEGRVVSEVAGTTIGNKRLLRVDVQADSLELHIEDSRGGFKIRGIEAFG